ncbi:acyl-CoA dehydrogenase [Geobacillus sp. 46C-IIa]|uniref:acyl-CoA dehydrogenase family protein n=1 Tax=Geobacillus sp. 46C-IIa TaxID=1963025 RepID=UPI0009BE900D|nr:acyl-CoA dehydrogenase family protein [Geobacillus sp. 46C-IIa]OQP06195.1 acyl-CoA dehydrogenase [Geobacillus sp. 46C-IIa]QNU29288.1 acyl-CoA dehydrogenase family protein [Geobacillus sp. 46C-IIa]
MAHWMFQEHHEMFRKSVKKFVEKEITPYVEEWEENGEVPKKLFERLGELGYLGIKYPKEYGGLGLDFIMESVFIEELAKCGSGGVGAAIGAHIGIATPPIWRWGTHEQKKKYLTPAIQGKMIAALAITEPNAGSDVSSIETRAERHGDCYVLNGSKTFITNGVNADYVVIAAKTGDGPRHHNISLFIVETRWDGFSVGKKLDKLGWRSSDTGELYFENVKVPKENLLGNENEGFRYIMQNFQWERLVMALSSVALAEKALEDSIRYSKERVQFGKPIRQFQVLRHKMVDMAIDIEKARHITYRAIYLYNQGKDVTTEATMAKAYAGEMVSRVCDQAVQIHGGNGYMMEFPVQRYWRDARIQSIGGGTTQIMREILVKRLEIMQEGSPEA